MALKEYVGSVVLEINGREFEVIDITINHDTGKKLVKTMNRTGKALGFCRGIRTWEISLTVAIPKDTGEDVDWDNFDGAKITIYPLTEGGRRESYLDCVSQKNSIKYAAENEARVDVTVLALDKIKE
jgi:hypothetical protein